MRPAAQIPSTLSSTVPVRDNLLNRPVRLLFGFDAERREEVAVGPRGHEDVVDINLTTVELAVFR